MTAFVTVPEPGSFAGQLVDVHGRPMERALIRARQRYNAAKPSRQRLSRLHLAYRRKCQR